MSARVRRIPVIVMLVSAVLLVSPAAVEARPSIPSQDGAASTALKTVVERLDTLLRRLLALPPAPERNVPPLEVTAEVPPSDGPATDTFGARVGAITAAGQRALEAAGSADLATREGITSALTHIQEASDTWHGDQPDVAQVVANIARTVAEDLDVPGDVTVLRDLIVDLGSSVARRFFDHAVDSGADAASEARIEAAWSEAQAAFAAGDAGGGMDELQTALGFAQPKMVFDLSTFRQNLQATFASPQFVVGSSWGMYKDGALVGGDQQGLARVPLDGGPTLQLAGKEMNIASISKNLTAVLTLRLVQSLPLGIKTPIAPYLPSHWTLGPGVASTTFEDLMTQRSGLDQNLGSGTYSGLDYAGLRRWIAFGVTKPKTFEYQNQNFAILRVMLPKMYNRPIDQPTPFLCVLLGPSQCQALRDQWYAASTDSQYRFLMQLFVFAPSGINGDCAPTVPADTRTLLYRVYPVNQNRQLGLDAGNWRPICGGGGWHLSAVEIARFASNVRNGSLLSDAAREVMNTRFLGWMNPDDYGGMGEGARGTYHGHGGDLGCCYAHETADSHEPGPFTAAHPNRGMDSCLMTFPNNVQVAVLVNSQGVSYPGGPYQCAALQTAWEDAWLWQV